MTEFRSIQKEILIRVPQERVFEALVTPSDIKGWWGAECAIIIPETGGIWVASWGEDENSPDYITSATIKIFEKMKRLVLADYKYFTKFENPGFEADFSTEFVINSVYEGTMLIVSQHGFPVDHEVDAFYAACQEGWVTSLNNLKRYLER